MGELVAGFDIETTGLNPWEDRITTMAVFGNGSGHTVVFDDVDNEDLLLQEVEQYMRTTRIDLLVGWNITEFDLPFIAVRFVLNGIDLPPFLKQTGEVGKYGKPRYDGVWYGAKFHDVAYDWEDFCKQNGIKWSLKPCAEFRGIPGSGIYPDFEHGSILDLTSEQRKLYCGRDAVLAYNLYVKKPKAKGQAVLLDGGLSIL
jgi:DNA polymerase III epsilon subunit-like protein